MTNSRTLCCLSWSWDLCGIAAWILMTGRSIRVRLSETRRYRVRQHYNCSEQCERFQHDRKNLSHAESWRYMHAARSYWRRTYLVRWPLLCITKLRLTAGPIERVTPFKIHCQLRTTCNELFSGIQSASSSGRRWGERRQGE